MSRYAVMFFDGLGDPMGLACKSDGSGETEYFDTKEEAEDYGKKESAWDYKVMEV